MCYSPDDFGSVLILLLFMRNLAITVHDSTSVYQCGLPTRTVLWDAGSGKKVVVEVETDCD